MGKEKSKLQEFATKLKAKDHFIKASFGGFAGTGKTRTASEFIAGVYQDLKIKKPLLIVDNEKGSRFLVKFFEDKNIETYVKETVQLSDVIGSFRLLNDGEIGFLFIDSLSKVWYQYVRDYKELNGKKTFMTLQDWGKILPAWQEMFSDQFVNLDGNCVFTGRGGYTYDMEVNEETKKKEFNKSGVKMKLAGETPFEPDINVWMEMEQEMKEGKPIVWREAQIMKDRSGLIDGMTFKNPTYKDFQPVVKYLMQIPTGEVAGSTSNNNLAPSENFEYLKRTGKNKSSMEFVIKELTEALER
ncbi:MAG: AAA family ATPase [Ignavibacteria bacterium]|nr:AAA family ATPase [Ignavibacteria bacterium]